MKSKLKKFLVGAIISFPFIFSPLMAIVSIFKKTNEKNKYLDRPNASGTWIYEDVDGKGLIKKEVFVECGAASGIYCKELSMGGSAQCGFKSWSGLWRKK